MTHYSVPPEAPSAPRGPDETLRERALTRLKKKRDFYTHVLVYLVVNSFLVVIWSMTSGGFFWPAFPMAAWGIGVVMNAWDVWQGDFSEADIEREVARLQRRR
jgi:uncharacterized ion transporter superfamily protein YfcC